MSTSSSNHMRGIHFSRVRQYAPHQPSLQGHEVKYHETDFQCLLFLMVLHHKGNFQSPCYLVCTRAEGGAAIDDVIASNDSIQCHYRDEPEAAKTMEPMVGVKTVALREICFMIVSCFVFITVALWSHE